ncbi:MAG: hypothetical protein LBJ41_03540 [Treponema sp.]|jgi:oligopeptide/dipeptide ABC transporter ATP-binding protein|nr:hypothetical protein [Treponema sp.]
MEYGETESVYLRLLYPYTQAVLAAVPSHDPLKKKGHVVLEDDVPHPANPPVGCAFHTRCLRASAVCRETNSDTMEVEARHFMACHHF